MKRLPGLLGLGPVEGDYTSTPLSYYDLGAMPWGYRGQPLESLRGVILMPLLDGFGGRFPPYSATRVHQRLRSLRQGQSLATMVVSFRGPRASCGNRYLFVTSTH